MSISDGYPSSLSYTEVVLVEFRYFTAIGDTHFISPGDNSFRGVKAVEIKLVGRFFKVWDDRTLKIKAIDATLASRGFGMAGEKPRFQNIMIGYDAHSDCGSRQSPQGRLCGTSSVGSTSHLTSL